MKHDFIAEWSNDDASKVALIVKDGKKNKAKLAVGIVPQILWPFFYEMDFSTELGRIIGNFDSICIFYNLLR